MNTPTLASLLASLLVVFSLASFAVENGSNDSAEDMVSWDANTLTGDWGGYRSQLYASGVNVGLTHKSDVLTNLHGGIKKGTGWIGHTEARIALDMDKLAGWDSTKAYFVYQSDLGSKFNSDHVGSLVGVDNIEVATSTSQFFDAWIEKSFSEDRFSVLFGIYHIDSEFYVTETSGLFLQPPYGMANEVALTGQNGPPIFPVGALALRMKYTLPGKNLYFMGAITDGVPGDPSNPHGTHIKLGKDDGTMSIAEFGYVPQNDVSQGTFVNKTAIGFWRYSKKFTNISGPDQSTSQGAYALAERTLAQEEDDPQQGLAGFVRFGTASEKVNVLDYSASIGLRYLGLIPGRDEDSAGFAVTTNHAGSSFFNSGSFDRVETDVEATYKARLKPWLSLQPTVQYIVNPGLDPALKNAWIAGLRFEIEL